jgi:hypothetical protein
VLEELMENVDVFVNGHFHPVDPIIRPFGNAIEFTAPAVLRQPKYQLIVVDNRRVSYHSFDLGNEPQAIVTMPVPWQHERYTFRDPAEIRVLSFQSNSSTFDVSGDVEGNLTFKREVKPGVYLYALETILPYGMHKIQISGDLDVEIEFAVHCDTPTYRYTPPGPLNCWAVILLLVLMIFWHLFIVYGMLWSGEFVEPLKLAHKWIRGTSGQSKWGLAVFLGPAVMGRGMRKLPLWVKVEVMLALAWGSCLPVGLFKIEDKIAGLWLFAFIVGGEVVPDLMYLMFPAAYLTLVLFSLMVVLSLYDYQPCWTFIVDFLLALAGFILGITFWIIFGQHLADHSMWLASFEFFIFPIIFFISVIIVYYQRWTCRKRPDPYTEVGDAEP